MHKQNLKIILAMAIAFLITLWLDKAIFLANTPILKKFTLNGLKITPSPTITGDLKIAPTNIIPTTDNPRVAPTKIVTTTVPTKKPTLKPSNIPTPTNPTIACPTSSNQSYESITVNGDYRLDKPAEQHPEINLALRGYIKINGEPKLVHYGGDTDPRALKINSLFANARKPSIINTYCVYGWDNATNTRSGQTECGNPPVKWPVTLIGLASTPGETLVIPPSGWLIDESRGLELMLLYADQNRVTFTNSTGDNWTDGYTLHIEDICVDPNLIAAYQRENTNGRASLPALRTGQIFGVAKINEVKVAIRDSGVFMDPRSDKDWW